MRPFLAGIVGAMLSLISVNSLIAGPKEDAFFIAKQHVNASGAAKNQKEMEAQLVEAVRVPFASVGASIIDEEMYLDRLLGDFRSTYQSDMILAGARVLEAKVPEDVLSEVALFYATQTGQKFLAGAFAEIEGHPDFVQYLEGPAREFSVYLTPLSSAVLEHSEAIQTRLSEKLSPQRQAEIFEDPQIIALENEALRPEIVRMLKQVSKP